MSVSCTSSPTATSTNVFTTVTESTTTSLSITTQPPETSITFSLASCTTTVLGLTISCAPSVVPYTTTIPGTTGTVQVPLTVASTLTSTSLVTLFGTSCTTINTQIDSPTSTPTPTPTPTPVTTPTTTSSSTIFSPTVITTQSTSTQSNGSVAVQTVTQTSMQAISTIASNDKDSGSTDVAPIVGGTIGGFFGLIAIVALIWFILRRRRRWDDIFEKEENDIIASGARHGPSRFSLDVDPEPKPYQYGLVGQAIAPSAASPPHSPPLRPSAASGAANIHHARITSLTPLNPMMASNPTISSRPSTGGSQQPLYPPQQSYQAYQQQGYLPPLPTQQQQPVASNPGSLSHSHSASTASFTSPPVSHAHWTGGVGLGYNGAVSAAAMGMNMGLNTPVMTPDEVALQNRSGSPTSIQETRRLQVTNAHPELDLDWAESSSSAAAAAAAAAPLKDGKGRLVTRPTGPLVVHVDGGRLEPDAGPAMAAAAVPAASGPLPPAYTD